MPHPFCFLRLEIAGYIICPRLHRLYGDNTTEWECCPVKCKRNHKLLRCSIALCFATLILLTPFSTPSAFASTGAPGLVGRVIVLDPGHGGPDSGARSHQGDQEKEVTLKVAFKLADLLRQCGAVVYLTRTIDDDLATDEDLTMHRRQSRDLRNRTRFANSRQPDAFVSIHCNAGPSSEWYGAQTIYMTDNATGEKLAKMIQENFKQMLLPTKREADDMETLYLLKRIKGASVLAEIGFITNPKEAAALKTDAYQRTVAFALYTALMEYLRETDSPTDPQAP
jgi:N-acetylmuramoyl-L-alanine amidase